METNAGSDVPISRWSTFTRQASATHCHSSSSTILRCLGWSTPCSRVDQNEPYPADVTNDAEAVPSGDGSELLGLHRPVAQQLLAIFDLTECFEQSFRFHVFRTQIAEVLIQPVRHQPADHVVLPPALRADVAYPGVRDVPIVDHVVVVEDHHGRHVREEPLLELERPRLLIQPGVFLESVDQLGWQPLSGS